MKDINIIEKGIRCIQLTKASGRSYLESKEVSVVFGKDHAIIEWYSSMHDYAFHKYVERIDYDLSMLKTQSPEWLASHAEDQVLQHVSHRLVRKVARIVYDRVLDKARAAETAQKRRLSADVGEQRQRLLDALEAIEARRIMRQLDEMPAPPKRTQQPHSCVRRRICNSDEFDQRMRWW